MLIALTKPMGHLIAGGLVLGAVGVGVYVVSHTPTVAPLPVPQVIVVEQLGLAPLVTQHELAPGAKASLDASLVFTIGDATYMKLPAERMPKHGKATLVQDEDLYNAIAPVNPANVSTEQRAWLAKSVRIDTGCIATVASLGVISRLSGDTGYAESAAGDEWTAKSVMENGTPMLVAKLVGCTGGVFARDASLAVAVVPFAVANEPLAAAGKRAVLSSEGARRTAAEWAEATASDGTVASEPWYDSEMTTWDTRVLVHPLSGATFVSVYAVSEFSCGGPSVKLWSLFRANTDGSLTKLDAELGDIDEIDQLVDLDGDGELEVIGRPFLSGRMINAGSGTTLSQLDESFFGCPC